jgi:predicted nucleotidyltransferase
LLGVQVDVLTPDALPDHFRERVLSEAQPIWAKTHCGSMTI